MPEKKGAEGALTFAPNAIQVRHARLIEVAFKTNEQFPLLEAGSTLKLDPYPIKLSTFVGKFDPAKSTPPILLPTFHVKVAVELIDPSAEGQSPPYEFKVHVEGMFQCMADNNDIDALALANVHGTSYLFNMAREIIASLTSRSRHGLALLPLVVFQHDGEAVLTVMNPPPEVGDSNEA